eukprot:CAMPEP_0204445734 /NCGR_PEP_ID=MMETSP0470-20130426/93395_1 /ASSEMBLY_ACC=CAM_ASM_000385 /TAXON_ID=2969 /ORGANISM="Oxyrrhis marina" /LENGTH=231 /DNA_ID=CAMNT_0051445233 /DNA_START=17 /DNA_END=713 /DNA_ORIENTATION=-
MIVPKNETENGTTHEQHKTNDGSPRNAITSSPNHHTLRRRVLAEVDRPKFVVAGNRPGAMLGWLTPPGLAGVNATAGCRGTKLDPATSDDPHADGFATALLLCVRGCCLAGCAPVVVTVTPVTPAPVVGRATAAVAVGPDLPPEFPMRWGDRLESLGGGIVRVLVGGDVRAFPGVAVADDPTRSAGVYPKRPDVCGRLATTATIARFSDAKARDASSGDPPGRGAWEAGEE